MIIEFRNQKFLGIGITFDYKVTYPRNLSCTLYEEDGGCVVNLEQAKIIDGKIPSNWVMYKNDPPYENSYDIEHKDFVNYKGIVDFHNDVYEREKPAMSIYRKAVIEMWKECGKGFVDFPEFLSEHYYSEESRSDPYDIANDLLIYEKWSPEEISKETGLSLEEIKYLKLDQ